jgi:hypothetical protein
MLYLAPAINMSSVDNGMLLWACDLKKRNFNCQCDCPPNLNLGRFTVDTNTDNQRVD